jgi:DMSO/TMAO reductase YedYZ molybdopterin-dependent catalytic subunit
MVIYAGRTANGISKQARNHAAKPVLRVDGLVSQPCELSPEEIAKLPHVPFLDTVIPADLENFPRTDWSGVRLSDLLAILALQPDAKYLRVSAGPYGVPVAIDQADRALLCDSLAGEPLTVDKGGPWRLVVPDRIYFTSVKWVDRIEITAEEPDDSATRIAKARARARDAKM